MDETFTLLPLQIDPASKAITAPTIPTLTQDLQSLTSLHRSLLTLPSESHTTPPPPVPVNPKRSAQIQKMREQGNISLRKATPSNTAPATEAIKLYTYGVEMALGRPLWEHSQLVRDEASVLFANRSQAYMARQGWAEGAADAETSVELKRVGNGKAWWRRGRCLCEMGRWTEAREWAAQGMEVEGNEEELKGLVKEVEAHFAAGR